eukprot:6002796-Alexandrium_andersonii.AAC.1
MKRQRSIAQPKDWRDRLHQTACRHAEPLAGKHAERPSVAPEAIGLAESMLEICHIRRHAARAQPREKQHERI